MPTTLDPASGVAETIHGVPVADPYRWLEDRSSLATEAWIRDQQRRHDVYFSNLPELGWFRARVSDFLNVETFDQPARIKNHYFYRRRMKNQEQACICTRDTFNGNERVLVDPVDQGRFAAVAIYRISADGTLLAYESFRGGADSKAIHIVDVKEGYTMPDHLEAGHPRGFAFAPDRTGFYYCHELSESAGPHSLRLHRFGEATSQDEVIFRIDRCQQSRLLLLADESRLGALFSYADGSDSLFDFYHSHHSRRSLWSLGFARKRGIHGVFFQNGHMFAITEEGAPKQQIVELAGDGSAGRTIVPEWEYEIQCLAIAGGDLFVAYLADRQTVVRRWMFDGNYVGTVNLPKGGSLDFLPSPSTTSPSLFYVHESFGEPQSIFEYQAGAGNLISRFTPPDYRRRTSLRVESLSYRSKDGTEIPMSMVMRNDLDQGRTHPAILTGYGGFGVSVTPRFSVLVAIMLDLGAVFALPNIRGGSEFGRAWHDAARAQRRQVAFDDFVAAAEWLCARGIATPQSLAIFGGSNSGLLVAAAMTQRPDLFRAVLCIAPLLDMVRYEHFNSGRKWQHEYGTVDDPDDFHALHAYSSYHRVRDDVNYPSTLFVSGDMDDRCNPAHVRKMAALLQNRGSQQHAILLDYSPHRGHSPVLPLSTRVEALAKRLAFLCHELGVKIPMGEPHATSRP